MFWVWLAEAALESLGLLVPSPQEPPPDPPRVRLWILLGALVAGAGGGLIALLLFPPVPPAGFLDVSADAMTRARTWGLVGGASGGLVLGAVLGRAVARRAVD